MRYLFFHRALSPDPAPAALPSGLTLACWRPGPLRLRPEGLPAVPFLVWGWWHALGVFRSRDYAIVQVFDGNALVHRTCLLPSHFRFPFMGPGDLQAAGIWTRPDLRGRGLGLAALGEALRLCQRPGRTLWYMAREQNHASIRLAEKAGFRLWGWGEKPAWPGLGPLGAYRVTELRPEPPFTAGSGPVRPGPVSVAGWALGPGRGRPPTGS
jgi:RimJ/RimL family protein N-acetyltransferase